MAVEAILSQYLHVKKLVAKFVPYFLTNDQKQPTPPFELLDFLLSQSVHLLPHPPYFPNLTPADFFLFGYVNEKIHGQEFLSAQSAVAAYEDGVIFSAKKTWQSTFNNCYDHLSVCINRGGDSIE